MKIKVTFTVSTNIHVNVEQPLNQIEDGIRNIIIHAAVEKITRQKLLDSNITIKEEQCS